MFEFETKSVRIVKDEQGEPWFVAADVSDALGYRSANDMTRNLDDDEKGTQIVRTLGGDQELSVVRESGLYSAILKSRKKEAKRFKERATAEVLPSFRKTGGYGIDPMLALNDPATLRGLPANYSGKVARLPTSN